MSGAMHPTGRCGCAGEARCARYLGLLADCRLAELLHKLAIFASCHLVQTRLGDVRKRRMTRLNIILAQNVSHSHAQMLRVLETVQNRIQVLGPAT